LVNVYVPLPEPACRQAGARELEVAGRKMIIWVRVIRD